MSATRTFTIQPLTPQDAPACATIYFDSFQNSHSLACWPRNVPSVRAFWENMIATELSEPGAHSFKAIDNTTGELMGWCKWVAPKHDQELSTELPAWPEGANKALADETFGAWAEAHKEFMGRRGHWYLEIIATSPNFQRRGVGSACLAWGIERADAEGVQCYVEASPEAVKLYEKFGFREIGRTKTWIANERGCAEQGDGEWYVNLFMLRMPRAEGS